MARNLAAATALSGQPALILSYKDSFSDSKRQDAVIYSSSHASLYEDGDISGLFYLDLLRREDKLKEEFSFILKDSNLLSSRLLIFWDTPSDLSFATRFALFSASSVLMPFYMEAVSFDKLGPSLGFLEWVSRERGVSLPLLGLVPVSVNMGHKVSSVFSGQALNLFATKILPFIIPEDLSLFKAEQQGVSLFHYNILSPAAMAFTMLSLWIQEEYGEALKGI